MNRRERPIWAKATAATRPQIVVSLSLAAFGLALFLIGRSESGAATRAAALDALAPVLDFAGRPIAATRATIADLRAYFALKSMNEQLRRQNVALRDWQGVAQALAAQNAELKALLNFAPPPGAHFITASVIADASSSFGRSVVVLAGTRQGADRGQAAMTGAGLAGRVLEAGDDAARVLLLTDIGSRLPVRIERSGQPAMLAGNNGDLPELAYLPATFAPRLGDRVVTSGSGGLFPPNLPVGEVIAVEDGKALVRPYADLARLDYLRLVDFGLAGLLPRDGEADAVN